MPELRLHLVGCDGDTEAQVRRRLARDGVRITGAVRLRDASAALVAADPDVVLVDVDGGDDVGERLAVLKDTYPELPVVLLADSADLAALPGGVRAAVFDIVPKPLDLTRLDLAVKNAAQMHRLLRRVTELQDRGARGAGFHGIVGESQEIRDVLDAIEQVARTAVPVVVTGEGGSGKGLVARAIHDASDRRGGAFVSMQCAAIPAELVESELFGHDVGAFDGADAPYQGCCERAHGGTLYVEELSDVPLGAQGKLLQFARGGAFRRLGSSQLQEVDARIIAATVRDPLSAVQQGLLREELYYRLNVVSIHVPPLRRRLSDVPLLAQHFLARFAAKYGRYFQGFAPDATSALQRHHWPGNVRELENLVERIVVLHDGPIVTTRMLPPGVLDSVPVPADAEGPRGPNEILPFTEVERREIIRALRICGGNVSRAAERLEIGQATLYRKIKKYGLRSRRRATDAVVEG